MKKYVIMQTMCISEAAIFVIGMCLIVYKIEPFYTNIINRPITSLWILVLGLAVIVFVDKAYDCKWTNEIEEKITKDK